MTRAAMIRRAVLALALCAPLGVGVHAQDLPSTPAIALAEALVAQIRDTDGITELTQVFALADAVEKVGKVDRFRAGDAVERAWDKLCLKRLPCGGKGR